MRTVSKKPNSIQKTKPVNPKPQICARSGHGDANDAILQVQRTMGNHAAQLLLQANSGVMRAKLKVNAPGDAYEQEADQVADQVMRMPAPHSPDLITDKEHSIRAKSATHSSGKSEIAPSVESEIRSLLSGGRPLSTQERNFFEGRMGADFGDVRLHSDPSAANAATAIGARAFTIGNHIALAGGEYRFHSGVGRRLMAHELTHVLQNRQTDTIHRNPVAGLKAGEWLAVAALGYTATQDAVTSAAGDIAWKLAVMNGVLLPGGRTDLDKYREENPGLTVRTKELKISFWSGTRGMRKAGIVLGLSFNTDGKGIGNISTRVIDTYDWPGWGATCTVNLMPQTFVSQSGKAVVRVTLTNAWDRTISSGVDSSIWNLEGDGNFYGVRGRMWAEHSLS